MTDVDQMTMHCIACGVECQKVDRMALQPYGATAFYTQGHYGSTSFDPMDGSLLQIFVCDPCLMKHSGRVVHESGDTQKVWEPTDATREWVASCVPAAGG